MEVLTNTEIEGEKDSVLLTLIFVRTARFSVVVQR